MTALKFDDSLIYEATQLYEFRNLKNSITKGKSDIYGALGELLVKYYYLSKGKKVDHTSTYDYDLIIEGLKVDVKSKKTTVEPQPNYNCSIAAYNITQKCDYYYFVRIDLNHKIGYLLGYIPKDEFFEKATFNKEGDKEGNWAFKADCYNLQVKFLYANT